MREHDEDPVFAEKRTKLAQRIVDSLPKPDGEEDTAALIHALAVAYAAVSRNQFLSDAEIRAVLDNALARVRLTGGKSREACDA